MSLSHLPLTSPYEVFHTLPMRTTRCIGQTSCTGRRPRVGRLGLSGQCGVIRKHAQKAADYTNRRYRYKDRVDEKEWAKNKTGPVCVQRVELN